MNLRAPCQSGDLIACRIPARSIARMTRTCPRFEYEHSRANLAWFRQTGRARFPAVRLWFARNERVRSRGSARPLRTRGVRLVAADKLHTPFSHRLIRLEQT